MINVDLKELTDFEKKVLEIAKNKYPKETKNFMQRVGNRLKTEIRNDLKPKFKYTNGRKTGNLLKGLYRGRATIFRNENYQVRVGFHRPAYHAWLVEHGHKKYFHHKQFAKAKKGIGKVTGYHSVANVTKRFDGELKTQAEKFIDDFLNKGLS